MNTAGKNKSVQPYLFFDGRAEEAIEFYKKTVGAEVEMLMRFKDSPDSPPPGCAPSPGDKIMHASVRIGDTTILVSDGECKGKANFQGFALSLTVANAAEAEKRFKALSDGGQVIMPLMKTFFSPSFGMTNDRFGLCWMVYVTPAA